MLYLLFGALCITTAPLLVKSISLGAAFIGFVRCLSGAIFLSWFLFKDRDILITELKKWDISKWLLLAGFAFFADLYVWHNSIHIIGAGKSTVLGNTQVFYTSIMGYLIYHEKISQRLVFGSIMAIIGIVLLIWFEDANIKSPQFDLGIIYGLLTGLFYSIYIFSLSKLSRHKSNKRSLSDSSKLAMVCYISSLFLLPASIIEGSFIIPSLNDFLILLSLGFIAQFLGWLCIKKGLSSTPIAIGGLILLLQPTLATIFGVILFNESLVGIQILGLLLTIMGIALGTYKRSQKNG